MAASPRAFWRDEPLSWSDLERALSSHGLERLLRLKAVQQAYEAHLERLAGSWRSAADFVLHSELGYAAEHDRETALLRAVPPQAPPPPVFVLNGFPYHVAEGIENHLLWSAAGPLAEEEVVELLEQHRPSSTWETLRFVNPPKLQSIKAIWHTHVLSRRRGV
jgi:hypothetical protein